VRGVTEGVHRIASTNAYVGLLATLESLLGTRDGRIVAQFTRSTARTLLSHFVTTAAQQELRVRSSMNLTLPSGPSLFKQTELALHPARP
jgi:hypothetical protein